MASNAMDRFCELPREVVKTRGENPLCDFRCSKQQCCLCHLGEVAEVCNDYCSAIDASKQYGMERGPQLVPPFLQRMISPGSNQGGIGGSSPTQVIQAPLFDPNANCHAGSNDW